MRTKSINRAESAERENTCNEAVCADVLSEADLQKMTGGAVSSNNSWLFEALAMAWAAALDKQS